MPIITIKIILKLLKKHSKIACGYNHTILIDNKNQVYSFGSNNDGQLGLRDKNNRSYPERITKILDEGAKFIKIACGYNHTILIDNKNQVYSFGRNNDGQLGLGYMNNRSYPERITKSPDEGAKFIKIACGDYHTLLLDDKNQVYSFGWN